MLINQSSATPMNGALTSSEMFISSSESMKVRDILLKDILTIRSAEIVLRKIKKYTKQNEV